MTGGTKPTVDPADPHGPTIDPADPHGTKPTVDPADPHGKTVDPTDPTDPHGKTIDPNEPQGKTDVGPTPENPQKMTFLGEDVDVIKIETNKKGQKVLHTSDGLKITLDEYDRPLIAQDKDEISHFIYDNINDKKPALVNNTNKKGQLISKQVKKDDGYIKTDYKKGVIIENGVEQYIPLTDYPANAVIPDSNTFSKLMAEQIEKCTDNNILNDLKQDYSLYNTHYGTLDGDLFKKFQLKEKELAGIVKTTPHKPLSDLITGSTLDNALQKLNVKKYGKKGLPLKYSHEAFMADLEKALKDIPDAERMQLMSDLNIKLKMDIKSGHYELADIPKLPDIAVSPNHEKILNILNKYAKQNELQISDPALKAELEKFIKDVPEFSFMIGKPQNSLHAYSLDSHTIQNLQKALSYAEKAGITPEQKEILKMSILLHDIGKQFKGSKISDTGHAALSKVYAESILERFNYPQSTKNKILNLIENHHWFKEFNKGNMTPEQVLATFGDDIELAKIMAKADLESVSDDFHLTILEPGKTLTPAEFETKFQQKMDELNPAIKPELIGEELPTSGALDTYKPYVYEPSKMDKLLLGNVEVDFKDPTLQKLMSELKEGESFAIGCQTSTYADVKYKIGSYADGVGNHHIIISKKQGQIVIDAHKPTSVIKDIPTKINSDPAIAKKIDKLRKQASSISTKMFTINGKQTQFEILHGTQGGSNTGYYVINKETGELFYAKEAAGGNKLQAEMAAAQLYAAAGIDVPEISSFNASDGTNGILSKYVPDLNNLSKPHALANEGFGMDVLLNNWDVVGTGYDNILITADGKRVVRIDAGGSFDYHAKQSGSKPFGAIPTELITLLDSNINSYAANIFGKMSRADMIKSLEKAANIKVGDITTILNNAGVGHYADTLLARRKFIKSFLEELKANPQGSMSTLDYMRKMMNNTLDKSIATAKTKGELEDIKNALQYVIDPKVKAKLQNNIDIKANEIAASTPLPKTLSEVQVQNLLLKNGFTKNYSGDYVLSLDHATKDKIYNDYASQGSYIIKHMETPLSPTDIQNIQTMINEASAYINVNSLDPKRVVLLYNCIKSGGSKSIFGHKKGLMTPAKWAVILNIAQSPQIKPAQLGAFDSYKGFSTSINKGLLALAEGKSISKAVQAQIDEMQAYIGTQIIPDKIVVHRAEGYFGSGNPYGCLHTVTLPNGKTLDQALEEARLAGSSAIAKMEHEINTASTRHVATNNCFTSAFYNELQSQGSGKVVWELEVQKGAKGAFIEGNNFDGNISSECEIILQKDSKFQIVSIKWEDSIQKWKVKAKVNN